MARCACGTGTCSCVVKAANDSVAVVGNGSPTRPYLISIPGGNPLANIDVVDSPTLDLTISGAGTPTDKRKITGAATQSLTNLKDVQGTPTEGEIPVWRTNHWEFEAAAAAGLPVSGSWGTPPLDAFGSNSLVGREVYLDVNSQLRARPEEVTGKLVTDLPTTYPYGTTQMYIPAADQPNWPGGQLLVTHRSAGGPAAQWCYLWSGSSSKSWYRNGSNTLWAAWTQVAGMFSGTGVCSTALTPGTAQTDIPGMAVTVPIPGPASKFRVDINLDLQVVTASGGNFIAALAVPGGATDTTKQIVFNGTTDSPAGFRTALSQHYLITGLGASSGTVFKATAAGTTFKINPSHSALTVQQVA